MKAKKVNESMDFKRGENPEASLGVGKLGEVKEILTKIYEGDYGGDIVFEINSLDNIVLRYSQGVIDASKDNLSHQRYKKQWKRVLAYKPYKPFIVESEDDMIYRSTGFIYIHERRPENQRMPHNIQNHMDWQLDVKVKVRIYKTKKNFMEAQVICDALNKLHGEKWGFFPAIEKNES